MQRTRTGGCAADTGETWSLHMFALLRTCALIAHVLEPGSLTTVFRELDSMITSATPDSQ